MIKSQKMSSAFSAFLCLFGIYITFRLNVDATVPTKRQELKAAIENIAKEAADLRAQPADKRKVALQLEESIALLKSRNKRQLFKFDDIKEELQRAEDVVESVLNDLFDKDPEALVPLWKHMVDNWVATFTLEHKYRLDKTIRHFQIYLSKSENQLNKKIVEVLMYTLSRLRKTWFVGRSGSLKMLTALDKFRRRITSSSPIAFRDVLNGLDAELKSLKVLKGQLEYVDETSEAEMRSMLSFLTDLLDLQREKLPRPRDELYLKQVNGIRSIKLNIEKAQSQGQMTPALRNTYIDFAKRIESYLMRKAKIHFLGSEEEELMSDVYTLLYKEPYTFGLFNKNNSGEDSDESSESSSLVVEQAEPTNTPKGILRAVRSKGSGRRIQFANETGGISWV